MKARRWLLALALASTAAAHAAEPAPTATALVPLPSLNVPGYMGTWYQVAWFPNRFQKQCVSDTQAQYRQVPGGVEVLNRCRLASGEWDSASGLARPNRGVGAQLNGDLLQPAALEVSFLPAAFRWLPIWGDYWLLRRPDDGRYAVVSEASRQYLWVLSRTPQLLPADETEIRSFLLQQGFDLSRWTPHPHTNPPPAEPSR